MPQNCMNYGDRRRGTRRNACKADWLVIGQVPGTGFFNGAVVPSGSLAVTTRTSENTPVGTLNGTKPQCRVNGYINHRFKGKRTKALSPRTPRKEGRTISAVARASAAGRVSSAAVPGGISVYGATSLDVFALPCNSDQMAPEPRLSAAAKRQRRWKQFRHKKRPQLCPSREEENWENEVQEVTLDDREKMCSDVPPYGPEDMLHFALRDLTLKQRGTVELPVTANYRPAVHHPCPVKWSCHNIPTEPGQFADADE